MTTNETAVADPLLDQLDGLPVAILSDAATKLGLANSVISPSLRRQTSGNFRGRAATLNRVRRPDNVTQDEVAPELKSGLQTLIDTARPGSVLVIATQGDHECALWGANMATRAKVTGVVGVVTEGSMRDRDEIDEMRLPIFAQEVNPRGGGFRHYLTTSLNEPVICGGVYIRPGDILIGDGDGVIAIRPEQVETIAAEARRILQAEDNMIAFLREGGTLSEGIAKFKVR